MNAIIRIPVAAVVAIKEFAGVDDVFAVVKINQDGKGSAHYIYSKLEDAEAHEADKYADFGPLLLARS